MRAPDHRLPPAARELVAAKLGLDFPARKLADLERGVARAARRAGHRTPGDYLAWLQAQPADGAAWQHLAGDLTIGETYFFRDRAALDALTTGVLTPLIAERRAQGRPRLRIWSAGCSTGEEPYTIAMILRRLLPDLVEWSVTILGTDVNAHALEAARRGVYRRWSLRDTPAWAAADHLVRRGPERFEVVPEVRSMVTFAPLNLRRPSAAELLTGSGMMDVILCRNVLMYLTRDAQRAAVRMFQQSLTRDGWLLVSPAEASAELLDPLRPVTFPGAVLHRRVEAPAATVPAAEPAPPPAPPPPPLPLPQPSVERAREAADAGRLETAAQLCQEALGDDELAAEAHLLLAAVQGERDETAKAIASARAAVYAAPDSAPAHFVLGSLLFRTGAPAQARRSMETVTTLLAAAPRYRRVGPGDAMTAGAMLAAARAHLDL